MMKKDVLIGVFVKVEKLEKFIEYTLIKKYHKDADKIFHYKIDDKTDEVLLTFKSDRNKNILKELKNATILHVKNNCLFSINAINKLIEQECGEKNINYQIDWNKYKNTLLVIENGEFVIKKIERID